MKAGEVFSKTMPFVWAKLLLGLLTVLVSALLFGILMGISLLAKSGALTAVMFFVWCAAYSIIRFIINHWFGYLVKAGHIAVIAEAVVTGQVPANQVAYGKQMVKERFATANIYFVVNKLVSGAVKQIQRGIGKLGSLLSFVPGMGTITSLAQFFVDLSLGYIDECCLGYTFHKREQGACKSAADGVVIYAQNWKTLLGSAAKTMVMVILGFIGIVIALFVVLSLVFRIFNWPVGVPFVLALLLALAIKAAFIDSFILVRTMTAYMSVAPSTVITFDLYGKLSGISGKFKELLDKGREEQPPARPAYSGGEPGAYAQAYASPAAPYANSPQPYANGAQIPWEDTNP